MTASSAVMASLFCRNDAVNKILKPVGNFLACRLTTVKINVVNCIFSIKRVNVAQFTIRNR